MRVAKIERVFRNPRPIFWNLPATPSLEVVDEEGVQHILEYSIVRSIMHEFSEPCTFTQFLNWCSLNKE